MQIGISSIKVLAGIAVLCAGVAAESHAQAPATARDWVAQDEVFYQIFVRSFRDSDGDEVGDLHGIQQKLGYLKELGVTSLLLTPINPSPFYHNYFATSFAGVDRAYGDQAALDDLIRAVHGRGMKIYLDQEIQYTAEDHPWWKESAGKPGSKYSRFLIYHGPGNTQPESAVFGLTTTLMYNGVTVGLATVNLLEPEVRAYFADLFATMLDPNHDGRFEDGVDGFRIDHMMDDLDNKGVLKNLFADFWAPIFARVRATNPKAKIIAEQADWGYGIDFLTRGGADLVFAFPIRQGVAALDRQGIAKAINETLEKTPPRKGQIVFIENHDVNRFATQMNGDMRKQKLGAALAILLKGTPLIYYGQEIGMKGKHVETWSSDANDIPDREAMEWNRKVESPGAALWYRNTGPWWTNRFARDDDGISVEEQSRDSNSLLSYYRRLLALRHARPEIEFGAEDVVATDQKDVLAVVRSQDKRISVLLVNLANEAVRVVPELPAPLQGRKLKDLITNKREAAAGAIDLAPYGVKLLSRN